MKYIIIGLGNYGHVLAEELSALGHEIIGADISESRVDSIKDKVATAFVIDATARLRHKHGRVPHRSGLLCCEVYGSEEICRIFCK